MSIFDWFYFWRNGVCTKHLVRKEFFAAHDQSWSECIECKAEKRLKRKEAERKRSAKIIAKINKIKRK